MARLIDITGKAVSGEWGTDDLDGSGIPVLRTTNFTNTGEVSYANVVTRSITKKNISNKFLRKGDIIIEKSGGSDKQPVGRVIYFEGEENKYLFNNFTGLLRVVNSQKWHSKYVFYSLYAYYQKGGTRAFENKTTGLHNLKLENYLNSVEVRDLSLEIQVQRSFELDKLRKIITLRRAQLAKLDELVKCRFIELFGDPANNSKNWVTKPLRDCLSSIDGGKSFVCLPSARTRDWPAILKLSAITSGFYLPNENKAVIDNEHFSTAAEVKAGDLLFTRKNTPELVGISAYVYHSPVKLMIPDLIFRLNTNDNCNKIFLWKLINHELFRSSISAIATGSAKSMSNISQERLLKLHIICPPVEQQTAFADFVRRVDKSRFVVKEGEKAVKTLKRQGLGVNEIDRAGKIW